MDTAEFVKDCIADVESAYRQWLKDAKQEMDYTLSDQWKKEDKNKLLNEGRPALTFNKIKPIIKLVTGYQRQNRTDIKVIGVEGGDDFVAEIMSMLIKNIITRNFGEYKMSQMFQDGVMCSRGWLEADISYDTDILNGTVLLRNGLYYEMFPDPDSKDYTLADAEYVLK